MWIVIAVSGITLAQDPALAGKPVRTVIQPIAYLDVTELEDVLQLFDVKAVIKPSINAVILRGEIEKVDGALKALQALDVPVQAMDVTMFVVRASKEKTGNSDIPGELRPAIDQLKGIFGYSSFALLDTVSLRTMHNGSGLVGGTLDLTTADDTSHVSYQVMFSSARIIPEDGYSVIRLDDLSFDVEKRSRLKTDIEVREGQKAVLGRSSMLGLDLVLIIEAKIRPEHGG
jgi:hypothetical protein